MGITIAVIDGQSIVAHVTGSTEFIFRVHTIISSSIALPHQHQSNTDRRRILATRTGDTNQTGFSQGISMDIKTGRLDIGTNHLTVSLASA